MPRDPLDMAFDATSDPAWQQLMQEQEDGLVIKPRLNPADVLALFSTPLGEKVLAELYSAFVNVTIVEPGAAPETHGIRQGQANVVHWIMAQMEKAERDQE